MVTGCQVYSRDVHKTVIDKTETRPGRWTRGTQSRYVHTVYVQWLWFLPPYRHTDTPTHINDADHWVCASDGYMTSPQYSTRNSPAEMRNRNMACSKNTISYKSQWKNFSIINYQYKMTVNYWCSTIVLFVREYRLLCVSSTAGWANSTAGQKPKRHGPWLLVIFLGSFSLRLLHIIVGRHILAHFQDK